MAVDPKIVADKYQKGVYYVEGQQWSVGTRYTLLKLLGSGSFSSVVSAIDKETQEHVALKRIADVLLDSENAKRVLREVCILRRLEHPHIIGLKDVFLKPSSTGRYMYRGGALVPTSLDLYLALEFCEQGDLFHLKGQLSELEVKTIMVQLLSAVQYLHRNGVWHRDIKSANILMTYTNGIRYIKLADLGSARSTLLEKHLHQPDSSQPGSQQQLHQFAAATARQQQQQWFTTQNNATQTSGDGGGSGKNSASQQQQQQHGVHSRHDSMDSTGSGGWQQQQQRVTRLRPVGAPVHHSDSFVGDSGSSPSEIYARPVAGGGGGFKSPLTRMVCTPCYRAPEVVMSRGGYTEAIDMWGIGCVFGELLQRVAWIGKATTPQLQVAPVFAIHGMPATPVEGEHYAQGPANSVTRTELSALFTVIGVPSWRCIESVTNPAWRRYLRKVPPKAPTLFRRFGSAGEVAVDLLARLLAFDSARRCGCEEALAHEYFEDLVRVLNSEIGQMDPVVQRTVSDAAAAVSGMDQHMDDQEDGRSRTDPGPRPGSVLKRARSISLESPSQAANAAAAAAVGDAASTLPTFQASLLDPFLSAAAAAAAAAASTAAEEMEVDNRPAATAAAGLGCVDASPGSGYIFLPPRPPKSLAAPPAAAAAVLATAPALAPAAAAAAGAGNGLLTEGSFKVTPSGQHYYELDDPAAALAALEHDMAALMTVENKADIAPGGPPPQAPQPLRELLEREVQEHQNHLERRRCVSLLVDGKGQSPVGSAVKLSPPRSPLPSALNPACAGSGSIVRQWQHLQPDPGLAMDPSRIGFQRLPHHADAEQAHLDPQQHLKVGRHGEWAQDALKAGPRAGTVWGVSLVPAGVSEELHPELAAIIRSQHKR